MFFSKNRLLLIFTLMAIAVIIPMRWVDANLQTEAACCHFGGLEIRSPVLCFEFAWSSEKAGQTLQSWNGNLHYLSFGLGLDFLFLLIYPVVFFLVLQLVAAHTPVRWLTRIAAAFAPFALASGVFDAVENICLLRYIFGHHDEWLLKMAGICAGVKLGLLVLSALLIVSCLLTIVYKWTRDSLKKM